MTQTEPVEKNVPPLSREAKTFGHYMAKWQGRSYWRYIGWLHQLPSRDEFERKMEQLYHLREFDR